MLWNSLWGVLGGVPCTIPIAVVGSATAAKVIDYGLTVALVPKEFRAEGLLDAFPEKMVGVRDPVSARFEVAREVLPEELRRRGATVDVVTASPCGQSGGRNIFEKSSNPRKSTVLCLRALPRFRTTLSHCPPMFLLPSSDL